MITVVHDRNIPAVALNDDARMVLDQRYFTGKAKPNYPMPATIIVCAIHPYVVQIAEAYLFESGWEFELVAEYERLIG